MGIEKEVRYLVNDSTWDRVLNHTTPYKPKESMLDLTMGEYGFDSYKKTGLVFRIRQKGEKIALEIKKKIPDGWLEEAIKLENVQKGVSFLTLAGLKPVLYIDRTREVKKYGNLKIFFDDVKLLGKFIEIEYQDSPNAILELENFLKDMQINGEPQDLYGAIITKRYQTEPEFKKAFDIEMDKILKAI